MTMIEIKKIGPEDVLDELIADIKQATWSKTSDIDPSDYTTAHITKSLQQHNHIFCVAYHEGQFAGMASAFVLAKPDGDNWLYVNEMDVSVEKQQKGVGTELMKFLFEEAIRLSCIEVWLGTEKDNTAANALYNSLQPTDVEEFVGYNYKINP